MAVSGDADALTVDDAQGDGFVYSDRGIGFELFEVSIVGGSGVTNDGEGCVVDDGVAGQEEQSVVG
ncbi:hypothetical protein P303_12885 [Xylella fastidiosa MUL0034]|nr:hypothetical protein P303_12885 [Xylella fastidiosa MUL0034]